jgi:predicted TIM-barrel fold metal-dependent hydrolase
MRRRDLLQATFAAGPLAAGSPLAGSSAALAARGEEEDFPGILDSNVSLFRWPFRRLPLDDTEKLVAKQRSLGITGAIAGSFEGIFHRDLAAANARLLEECARFPGLVPAVSVNPALPGWERELAEASGVVRLHPGYHGYGLDDPRFAELLAAAAERGLLVQLAVALEDVRTQPELVRVAEVDLSPLPGLMARVRQAAVQLLNAKPRPALLQALAATPGLLLDTALADGTDAVARLVEAFGADRVLFGTHAPFLIPEAALVRVHESTLEAPHLRAVLGANARRALGEA